MTPDEARRMLDGTTPGPWEVDTESTVEASIWSPSVIVIGPYYDREDAERWETGTPEDLRLAAAGLLAPGPQIIRTLADLEALDPQTILDTPAEAPYRARDAVDAIGAGEWEGEWLPAVVIATGEQVRAAQQALEEE